MKNMLVILICMCLTSLTQAAIVAFDAEDDSVYYQAGASWTTVENEAALGGECITGTIDMPAQTNENTRYYSFQMQAGTYHLFVRLNMDVNNGGDDSFYVSNNSLAEDAPLTDFNGYTVQDIDGNSMAGAGNFGWIRVHQSWAATTIRTYVMAAPGVAYFKAGPRENGLYLDAFAFVPAADADTVTSAELTQAVIDRRFRRGAATDPVPSGDTLVDSQVTPAVSWTAPVDPNLASISGYDVFFGTEPNMLLNTVYPVSTTSLPVTLAYDTTYYWRVDTHIVWDSNDIPDSGSFSQTVQGYEWIFTTLPDDLAPVVTANDILTSIPYLPATLTGTVNDSGEGDIATVTWEFLGTTAVPAAKQMLTRTQSLSAVTADPNLLMDWIGTDTREIGEPMYLSLKGLPAGTYNWLSYHHDAENQTGVFDVTVYDASGTAETTGIAYRNGNSLPVITVPLTITSNGTDDVVLSFDLQSGTFFVMNGFELTKGVDSLNIDFGNVDVAPMPGYQAYVAQHEVAATFTEQSYSAFGTTVSVLPTWGGMPQTATVTDTTNDASSASQTATFGAEWPGSYLVRLSATDNASQTGSDTLTVRVVANACAAAQLSPSWSGFSDGDFNKDCVVDLEDFASLAAQWLNDRNMTAQE